MNLTAFFKEGGLGSRRTYVMTVVAGDGAASNI
jgi:hypothetical protein